MTTLEWSVDGSLLATGCMDGIARLWSREGVLQHSLNAHSESIFSLRFDSAGKRLLTGSYDKCVSVWDVRTGSIQCRTYIIQVKRPLQESCSISLKPIQHKSLTLIGKLASARAHSNSDCISNSSIVQVDIMGLMFSRRAQQIAQLLSVRLQTERLTPTRQQQLPHRCRC